MNVVNGYYECKKEDPTNNQNCFDTYLDGKTDEFSVLNFHIFAAFFIDGFAFTAETLVGESKGARDFKMFREYVIASSFWCLLVGVFCSIIFWMLGSNIVSLLTDIPTVNQYSGTYLIWIVILPVISAVSYQLDGIFLGATQTSAMRNGMFISLVVLVVSSFYLVSNLGNHGLWCAFVLFMITRCLTLGLKYKSLENTIGQTVCYFLINLMEN